MATQSNASAKVPRVKVETAQNQQTTSNATPQKVQVQEPAQSPAQKAPTAPKPRVDVGTTQEVAKSVPKPKVAVVAPQKAASAGDSVPAQKAGSAKKPAPKPKVTMAAEPEAEVPVPAQPTATPTQSVEAAMQAGPSPATGTGGDSSAADASQDQVTNGQRIQEARRSILAWVHNTFPGHEHAFWGGVVALVMALMVFIIGPLRVLLIILLVLVGVAVGQVFDGDPKIIRIIAGLFDNDRDQS